MTGHGPAVFLDASGRRAARLRLAAAAVGALALALLAVFVLSIVNPPRLRGLAAGADHGPALQARRHDPARLARARRALLARIAAESRTAPAKASAGGEVRGAWFAPWREGGLADLRAHARNLTHVYPAWLSLTPDGRGLDDTAWRTDRGQSTRELLRISRAAGLRVVPVVSNAQNGEFDARRLKAMLADPAAAAGVADRLAAFVRSNRYDGLQIDFELLDPATARALGPWLEGLAGRLHAFGAELSMPLEPELDAAAVRRFAAAADYVLLMAYDEHESSGPPGPVASLPFVERALARFIGLVPPAKLVLAVGGYGYDWDTQDGSAEPVTVPQAMALADRFRTGESPRDVVDFDPVALEPTFQYRNEAGRLHEVWFLDAATARNAVGLARARGVRGVSLWALGMEDASVWATIGPGPLPAPASLQAVAATSGVNFIGDGELLRVLRRPQPGRREMEVDPRTGLITDENYSSYPSGWAVERSGAPAHTVALTFDDGPDPTWTPRILDVLKREGVHATFFMIGRQVADQPDLVRRVYAEGHEIGSHSFTHPNMAHVSEERVRLELSATQRAFEAILGRSVALFRPPFNADSEPRGYGEIMPVAVAGAQGYVTAGETIDPNDWEIERKAPDGRAVRLTGPDVAGFVLANVGRGQSVLLHDGGGDRSATLAALPAMIRGLKAQGYRFSTMGGLEGRGRAETMPVLPARDRWVARVDAFTFDVQRVGGAVFFWGFNAAIALGLLRIALMIGLAARKRSTPPADPAEPPRVDVLVAAYNEAAVIVRTLESLLACRGVDQRVIVVDDGSQDGTGDIVERFAAGEPRVRLYRKPNGGKASALNLALSHSDAPVAVGVDADTQLDPDALAKVARWFADPTIGAVAGNVKVGNRGRLVTRWQSLEYVTSQNVDRRALSRLNAITVVPGALGAYRADALRAVGGYRSDTLAEDMDLTWRLRRAGWRLINENGARAYTEAPDTLRALMRQRFRWTFGTLQCLWKHRAAVGRYGWFGGLALPTLWLFQIAAQILAPFVDLELAAALIGRASAWWDSLQHVDMPIAPDPMLWFVLAIYVAFLGLEIAAGWVAYAFDGADKRELWLLPTQRLVYRQVMYLVVWRSLLRALGGAAHGWGVLQRRGTVRMEGAAKA